MCPTLCYTVRTSFSKKYEDKNSDSEEEPIVDPKIQKELEEVAKIQDSAMVRCIREDVAEQVRLCCLCAADRKHSISAHKSLDNGQKKL